MNLPRLDRSWSFPMTIGRSFLLWLLGVLLIVLVVVSALVLWHERSLLERELVERAEVVARALLAAATDERSPVYPVALSLADLRSGEVCTANGEILWSYGLPPEQALELDPDLLRVEVVEPPGASPTLSSARAVLLVSKTRISAAIATAAVRLVLALAMVLPIALFVGLLVVERIVRPLRRLGGFLDGLDPATEPRALELGPAASEVADLARTTVDMATRLHLQRTQLAASERRFRELFLDSPTPLLHFDRSLVLREANPSAAALLGISTHDATGTALESWLGDRAAIDVLADVAAGEASAARIVEAAWPLGREGDGDMDVELHVRALGDGTALLAVHDLTERMRRVADRWRRTFDAMSDGVALLGAGGGVVASNRAMDQLAPDLAHLVITEASTGVAEAWRTSAAGRVLQCALSPMAEGGEKILVVRDITDTVAAEARLREAEKLEAIGSLASGVAHDFNNLLAGIQLQARLLRRDPEAGDDAITAILDLAEEGSDVVRELLIYSQREHTARQLLELGALLRSQEALLRHLTPSGVAVDVVTVREPVLVLGNPVGLRRMVLNLFLNAVAAVTDGGTIQVIVATEPGAAVLEVADDGVGIEPEAVSRVFEPFYSTRRSGRGAGLGLAVVQRVASDHGGRAEVGSRLGEGTTVRVRLPLADPDEVAGYQSLAASGEAANGPRVLVVMADPGDAAELMERLARRGLDPRHARDGSEAAESMADVRPQVVIGDSNGLSVADPWLDEGVPVVVVSNGTDPKGLPGAWLQVENARGIDRVVEAVLELLQSVRRAG